MKKIQLTINLKKELKKDFNEKVLNSVKFNGVSEALNILIQEFLKSRDIEVRSELNKEKITNGFYITPELKEEVEEFIDNTKEFTNTTDLVAKVIYNYLYSK